ncbi:MAG: putative toxin-antitoxin system toxin component, PIN family [Thermoguttaceae bacterium]|nr:putative toxin-antitoxin system toxin component, PIN family [Thermoguttaceae bacterium]
MRYYAVIDTNVLVSAVLKQDSVPGMIVELAFGGLIIPVLDETIENEYRKVLTRPKFHLTEDIVETIVATFRRRGLYINADTMDIELPDPKDRVFYEIVMEERKEKNAYLVTGNIRHFPSRPFIVTPRQMLNIILKEQDSQDGNT